MEAPTFNPDRPRSTYPLGGKITGPAWRAAWSRLRAAGDVPLDSVELSNSVAADLKCNPRTVKNLLMSAERAGILERTVATVQSRQRAHYRISPAWSAK